MPQVFSFYDHPVRTIIENGQPWFAGSDIAKLLGYVRPDKEVRRICKHVKLFKPTNLVGWGNSPRGFLIIPESDVWRLIVHSTLPKAQEVEKWIMGEVLPAIRKTGKFEAKPKQKALPAAKPKTLPIPMPEVTREKLPLPYPFPKEKIDVLLSQISYHMLKIKHAEQDITEIVTAEYLRRNPGVSNTLKDRRYSHYLYLSCSSGSLWQSIDFALKAIEESVNLRLEISA